MCTNETAAPSATTEAARDPEKPREESTENRGAILRAAWTARSAPLLARELLDFLLTVPDAARVVLIRSDDAERVRYSARRDTVEIHGEVQE